MQDNDSHFRKYHSDCMIGSAISLAPKTGPQNCPQCGTPASSAHAVGGRVFCVRCRQQLIFCRVCGGANLAWSDFCHNCGKRIEKETITSPPELASSPPVKTRPIEQVAIERMHLCVSCKKTIGEGEPFCSYCGAKQPVSRAEGQAQLDPHTMKAAVTMLARITEAKDHRNTLLLMS